MRLCSLFAVLGVVGLLTNASWLLWVSTYFVLASAGLAILGGNREITPEDQASQFFAGL